MSDNIQAGYIASKAPDSETRAVSPHLLLKLALIPILAWLAYLFIDFRQFWKMMTSVSPLPLAGLLAIATFDRFLMAYKWRHLARGINLQMPLGQCVRSYYVASFLSYFIPTGLGGDLYRGHKMSQIMDNKKDVFASLLMEKAVGFLSTATLFWCGLAYFLVHFNAAGARWIIIQLMLLSALAVGFILLTLNPGVHSFLMRSVARFKASKITNAMDKFYLAYMGFGKEKKLLFVNYLISVFENFVQFSVIFFASRLLGLEINAVALLSIISVTNLVRRIAMYFDSWGITEAAAVAMYGIVGIPPSTALAMSILRHVVFMAAGLPGGVLLALEKKIV